MMVPPLSPSASSSSFSSSSFYSTSSPPQPQTQMYSDPQYASAFIQPRHTSSKRNRTIPGAFLLQDHNTSNSAVVDGGSRKRSWQPSSSNIINDTTDIDTGMRAEFIGMADADADDVPQRVSRGMASQSLRAHHQPAPADDEQGDSQPRKKRRGLAGTIVDDALNGLIYGGAAALTAYSLWSSWGQNRADNKGQQDGGSKDHDEVAVSGVEEEEAPPPPYPESSASPFVKPSTTPQQSRQGRNRNRNIYVSSNSRRRVRARPAFASSRSRSFNSPRNSPRIRTQPDLPTSSSAKAANDSEEEPESEDERYLRFQEQMTSLIAQGQAALNSQAVVLDDTDLQDNLPISRPQLHSRPSLSGYNPRTPTKSRIPIPRPDSPRTVFRGVNDVNLDFGSGTPLGRTTYHQSPRTSLSARVTPSASASGTDRKPFVFGSGLNHASTSSSSNPSPSPFKRPHKR
ncbi:unnamed protein product [Sympodiomycopsis kandeliae]